MLVHLTSPTCSVVLDLATGVPTVRHWGAPLADTDLAGGAATWERPLAAGGLDTEAPLSLLPEHGAGFPGRPGLAGHRRGGRDWAPRLRPAGHDVTARSLRAVAVDPITALRVETTVELDDVLRVRHTLTNDHRTERYLFDRVDTTLPVPDRVAEVLDFGGRWAREMHPRRTAWHHGALTSENRAGRTSHEHPPLLFLGTPGFGEWHGEVWGLHLAWSGNHAWLAEALPDGRRYVQFGELFHPGEMSLRPGESYTTPELIGTYSAAGLTPASWNYHRAVRAAHPVARPRPIVINTWEAVYFDHDADVLRRLATAAAGLGVERFVLDDGWFGSRRDDRRGLGDWHVSPVAHPHGLAPLIEHVRALGMDVGIWVEPEMVNPDSDLHRAHPEWVLGDTRPEPVLGRNQLVLDLARPDAFAHILDALDALLRDHDIAFVKWDMNRPHVGASGAHGAAGTHEQTLAVHRLLDELRARHPAVEFESCASGGGRIDHEVLRRVERVWTSDTNDALERQTIQRGLSMFVPPEIMGAHIGPPRSHTTGRRHSLAFRAATAMFGSLGIEWNVLDATAEELRHLAEAIALHKRFRPLLHAGDVVRFDASDGLCAHGVHAADRRESLVCVARLTTAASLVGAPLLVPGLEPTQRYRVRRVPLPGGGADRGPARTTPPWLRDGASMTGRALAAVGVQLPVLNPETALLIHLVAEDPPATVEP